jgi:hypothetical protein
MNQTHKKLLLPLSLILLVMLSCNMPGVARPTESGASALYTAAAQTVIAQMTQVSGPPATPAATGMVPTFQPPTAGPTQAQPTQASPTQAPGTNTAPAPTALPTSTPAPTSVPLPCDAVRFVKDVTIADNTEFAPGVKFTKTWRLRNNGTCTWTTGYSVVFVSGDAMSAPSTVALPHNVAPGDTVDVSVPMVAPDKAGTYRGNWMLRNASGALFGLGTDGSKPFWAQIKVVVQTGITYDFLIKASDAEWISSVGTAGGAPLSFGGADDDPMGVAKIKDAVTLETGATSGKILLTYPRREDNGAVSGLFPAYTVQSGDVLRAKLGFMLDYTSDACGSGRVKFQIVYKEGGAPKLLQEWTKSCTGNFTDVNIDLSSLKGKTVQFGFVVLAEGSAQDDWAVWNSPRIEQ